MTKLILDMVADQTGDDDDHVSIEPVDVHDITNFKDERTARLRHLLELNHKNYSILYNNFRFHNHTPHFLGCAYLSGGSIAHLDAIYNDVVERDTLDAWKTSPGKIKRDNFNACLGEGEYQRAWIDFFDERIADAERNGSIWQIVASKYLFNGDYKDQLSSKPLIHGLIAGLGHPLIHLGYAYELDSRDIAVEALGLAAACYDHQLISILTSPSSTTSKPKSDLFDLFDCVHNDTTLPAFPYPDDSNLDTILNDKPHIQTIVSHLDSFEPTSTTSQFFQSYRLAGLLLISTSAALGGQGYDFFLVHALTSIQAIRAILPNLPIIHYHDLLRDWLLMTLLVYVSQTRPILNQHAVETFDLQSRDWDFVRTRALHGSHATDAHFIKACRALQVGAETFGDEDKWFLKCAVRFASEFEAWGGFATEGKAAEEARKNRIKDGIHVRGWEDGWR